MKILQMIAAAALSVAAMPAAAAVTAREPNSLVTAIQAAGYQAKLSKDKGGDPMIESSASGKRFLILFYGCKENRNCTNVQFVAYYTENTLPLTKINEWNRDKRYASVFIDKDGDPCLQMDVDLDAGGMSDALFKDNLETWTGGMGSFGRFIDQ